MKKTTRFMAATAVALAASAASAESSLTIYGSLDASLAHNRTENTAWALQGANKASTTAVTSGLMAPSFLGFKGTEDLGGGMEANFVLETPLDLDTGANSSNTKLLSALTRLSLGNPAATWNTRDEGTFWARNAYVGLKTNFGLIRLGHMEPLGYLAGVKWNPFGQGAINPTVRVFYGTDYYAHSWSNVIAYYLRMDGLIFAVQHAPKNDSTSGAGGAKTTAAVSYTAGPFAGSIGYEDNKDNVAASLLSPLGAAPAQAKSWALHASYDFGVVKLYGEYGVGKMNRELAAAQDVKSTGYQLGFSIPVGANGAVLASYAHGTQKATNTATVSTGTKLRDVKVYAIGYDYKLSKRTGIYTVYSNENDRYPLTAAANGALGGRFNNLSLKTSTFAIGVRHSF